MERQRREEIRKSLSSRISRVWGLLAFGREEEGDVEGDFQMSGLDGWCH